MKNIISKYLNIGKTFIAYALFISILIALLQPFEYLSDKFFVSIFLSKIKSHFALDLVFVFTSLLFVFQLFQDVVKGKQCTKRHLILAFIFTLFYSYYRFIDDHWYFVRISYLDFIAYSDLLFLPIVYLFSLKLKTYLKKAENTNQNTLLEDKAVCHPDSDDFGFGKAAENVAGLIIDSNYEFAFTIGISGRWGSGKTTFTNFIKHNLLNKDTIFIEFNAWNHSGENEILKSFLNTLSENIAPYNSVLSKRFVNYSKLILNEFPTLKLPLISKLFLDNPEEIGEITKKIKDELKTLNKKIVIVIDDLDRLRANEIFQVLKIVRNTADFPKITYLIPFDKDHVIKELESINIDARKYLTKFFTVELELPKMEGKILKSFIYNKIIKSNLIYNVEKPKISFEEFEKYVPLLEQFITTKRDAIKLINFIFINIEEIKHDVDYIDFINLALVKLFYPEVIQEIYLNKSRIFNEEFEEIHSVLQFNKEDKFYEITKLIMEYKHLSFYEQKLIARQFIFIFRGEYEDPSIDYSKNDFSFHLPAVYSIIYKNHFNRYFANTLFSNEVSEIHFRESLKKEKYEFIKDCKGWIDEGARESLYLKLSLLPIEVEQIQDFIQIIVELSYYGLKSESDFNKIKYDYEDLIANKQICEYLFDSKNNSAIQKLDISPYLYITGFFEAIHYDLDGKERLSMRHFTEVTSFYLKQYLDEKMIFDDYASRLLLNSNTAKSGFNYEISTDAKKIIQSFYAKYGSVNTISKIMIFNSFKNTNGDKCSISIPFRNSFDNDEQMLEFIKKLLENVSEDIREEVTRFLKELGKNTSAPIIFNFKTIKVDNSEWYKQ